MLFYIFVEDVTVSFHIQRGNVSDRLSSLCHIFYSNAMLELRLRPLVEAIILCVDWIVNYPDTSVTEEANDRQLSVHVKKITSRYLNRQNVISVF